MLFDARLQASSASLSCDSVSGPASGLPIGWSCPLAAGASSWPSGRSLLPALPPVPLSPECSCPSCEVSSVAWAAMFGVAEPGVCPCACPADCGPSWFWASDAPSVCDEGQRPWSSEWKRGAHSLRSSR